MSVRTALFALLLLLTNACSAQTAAPRFEGDVSDFQTKVPGTVSNTVYRATTELGTFNHHPQIAYHDGLFVVAWSNGAFDEDAPGQRVLGATSKDGVTWSTPFEMFARRSPVAPWGAEADVLFATGFAKVDGRLFALAEIVRRRVVGEKYSREGQRLIARSVSASGRLGDLFELSPSTPGDARLPSQYGRDRQAILRYIRDPQRMPYFSGMEISAKDGHTTIQPTYAYRVDGGHLRFLRDLDYSMKMYWQKTSDGREWSVPEPTNLPDSGAKSSILKLTDGRVVLFGAQIPVKWQRDPLTVATSADGWVFRPVGAVRKGDGRPVTFSGKYHNPTDRPGFSYPSSIQVGDAIFVVYSVGAEHIDISRLPVSSLAVRD